MKKLKYCYTIENEWEFKNPRKINVLRQLCGHKKDYRFYNNFIEHVRMSDDDTRIIQDWDDFYTPRLTSKSWKDKFKCKKQYEINLTF